MEFVVFYSFLHNILLCSVELYIILELTTLQSQISVVDRVYKICKSRTYRAYQMCRFPLIQNVQKRRRQVYSIYQLVQSFFAQNYVVCIVLIHAIHLWAAP